MINRALGKVGENLKFSNYLSMQNKINHLLHKLMLRCATVIQAIALRCNGTELLDNLHCLHRIVPLHGGYVVTGSPPSLSPNQAASSSWFCLLGQ